jgi:DNA-binding NarL/FixJ family response regulator
LLKVTIVEDYASFRRLVRLILQVRPDLTIVGEASDGVEAVQQAIELQPDLIILDLNLPTLNGIQAARRIVDLVPKAKIIFNTIESSSEVVEEAMKVGAGYVHKTRTSTELLPAIDTVLSGQQFVSKEIKSRRVKKTLFEGEPRRSSQKHEVAFYADDASLAAGLARCIEANLNSGHVVVVMAYRATSPADSGNAAGARPARSRKRPALHLARFCRNVVDVYGG